MARPFRIAVVLLAGFLSDHVRAQDFSARYAMVETGFPQAEAVPAITTLSGRLAIRPSLPTTLASRSFDDHSYVAFGTQVETGAMPALICGGGCEFSQSSKVKAALGMGSDAGFVYVSGGFTARKAQAFHTTVTNLPPERWTAGIGFTYQASSRVRFWGQIDRVAFSQEVLGSFAGIPAAGFAFKTGLHIPLDESFFADSHARMAADAAARRRFWDWLKDLFAPGKFMPQ